MPRLRKEFDPHSCSLLELCCVLAGGYVKGAKVCAYIWAWGTVARHLDREPTVEEYADFWGMSRRQAFYEQARFREAFADLDTPAPILETLHDAREDALGDFADLVPA
jgi:hypothetical protein